MAYKLEFPIILKDEVTGEEREATASEVVLSIDITGCAQTQYERDKDEEGGTAIWWENGAIFVAKMYPSWCPSTIPGCSPTVPVAPNSDDYYAVDLAWLADPSYRLYANFYLNDDGTVTPA